MNGKVCKPHKYAVLFQNDDTTPEGFVRTLLEALAGMSKPKMDRVLKSIQDNGEAEVWRGIKAIADTKVALATGLAREKGYPLNVVAKRL